MPYHIPDDWNGTDYCTLTATVPNSPKWLAAHTGALLELTKIWNWDADTGDPDLASDTALDTIHSLEYCMEQLPKLMFIVHLSTTQEISGPSDNVRLEFDTAEYNLDTQFNLTTHLWTVPETACYRIISWVQVWNMSSAMDELFVRVRPRIIGENDPFINSGNFQQSEEDFVHAKLDQIAVLNIGQQIEFLIGHSDSSNRDTSDYNRTVRALAWKVANV